LEVSTVESSCQSGDLEQLQQLFPDWEVSATWTVAGTGPDARYLQARKGGVTVTAWSAPDLGAQITAAVIAEALQGDDES
jgi:hypothetical protein